MVKKSIFFFFLFLIFFKAPVFSFKKYYLKVKLAPKVVEEKVYWQDRKDIDWRREIKNWHFGSQIKRCLFYQLKPEKT